MSKYFNENSPEELCILMSPEELKKQDNPLGLPEGWFKVLTAFRRVLGYGFYCPHCKFHAPLVNGKSVTHCGRVELRPTGFLAERKMQAFKLPMTTAALAAEMER